MSISKFMNAIDTVTKWVIGDLKPTKVDAVSVKRKGKRAKVKSNRIRIVKSREI